MHPQAALALTLYKAGLDKKLTKPRLRGQHNNQCLILENHQMEDAT